MSKLDDLINKLCPNGVEYKKLGDFASVIRGGNFQKKDFVETGKPCIHYGQMYTHFKNTTDKTLTFVSDSIFEKSKQAQPNDIVMAVTSENVEDVCSCVAWLGKENIAVSGHTAIIHHNQNPSYLSYYFHSELFFKQKVKLAHGTKVIEVTPDKLLGLEIPVPPLEVQNEIVRILDKFTSLEAELEVRRKQYEYYRDSLLTFGDDVEWKSIGELFDFKNGLNKDKSAFGNGIPFVKYTDVYNNKKIIKELLTGKVQLNEKEIESFGVHKGDVLFTRCSETKEEIGFASAVTEDLGDCAFNGFVLRARPKTDLLLPDYCAYCFRTFYVRKEIIRTCSFTTRANTTGVILSKIKIPVPSHEKQKQIATILDRFESLCNDITSGLPAEIEARHKQYEYYRDKLLTFKRKEVKA